MAPLSDVRNAQKGDMESFKRIFNLCSGFVFRNALRFCKNIQDAEDVTQEVFIKIHKNLKNFRFNSSFETWVYRITVNESLNLIRKNGNKPRDYIQDENKSDPEGNPEILFQRKEEAERLYRAFQRLTPEYQECLYLRDIEGFSYSEIGQILGINVNTAKTRARRGRGELLKILQKEVIE